MNICMIGGGNIGTVLLGELSTQKEVTVNLYTTRPEAWSNTIEVIDVKNKKSIVGNIHAISGEPNIVADADMILSTVPSHVFPSIVKKISPFVKKGTLIGIMPGCGGSEFFAKELLEKGCVLFGFQRVHSIARIKEYGHSVYMTGRKEELQIAAIPSKETERICALIERLLHIPCKALANYLTVTLTPSNPILHTSRIYSLFEHYEKGMLYPKNYGFYSEWTDWASELLLACDSELQQVCAAYEKLDLRGVVSLKVHYESDTIQKMTDKISHIPAFQGIGSPMKEVEGGFVPDFESRYFSEDFPYGLSIIKGFAELASVKTPMIDKILHWYQKTMKEIVGEEKAMIVPQQFGMTSMQEVYEYYQ